MHYMHVVKPYISHSGFTKIIQLKLTGENIRRGNKTQVGGFS